MSRSIEAIIDDIQTLVQIKGYVYILGELASRDLFFTAKNASKVNWCARVSFQELNFLVGLMLKQEVETGSFDDLPLEATISKTRELLEELHGFYNQAIADEMVKHIKDLERNPDMTDAQKDAISKQIFGSKAAMVETVFYSDSNSYDFQNVEMAPRLYQFDAQWLKDNNIDLEKHAVLYSAIRDLAEAGYYVYSTKNQSGEMTAKDIFTIQPQMLYLLVSQRYPEAHLEYSDIERFFELYSCTHKDQNPAFSQPGELNIAEIKPFIKLGDDEYFCPVGFNLAQALYSSPAYWMMKDKAYVSQAGRNRGKSLEQITYDYFKPIFGDYAFKSVKIRKGKDDLTDIDVMGVIGNKAVVVQCKGKRMTVTSKAGNEESLRLDFKSAVQDAYDQGIVSRDVILNQTGYKFIDEDGKEITLPQGIEEVYVMCVTADGYPAVLHQVEVYLDRKDSNPWPIAISLFDLDLLSIYLPDPYDFTLYMRQRINLAGIAKTDSEISFLSFHLGHGLFKPEKADRFSIDSSFAQTIDADYMHRKGRIPNLPKREMVKEMYTNPHFKQLLKELKDNVSDPKLTDVIFFLLSIPRESIDYIMRAILNARKKTLKEGKAHDISIPLTDADGDSIGGLTYVSAPTNETMRKHLAILTSINQYRSKSDTWLGIGAVANKGHISNAVLYSWEPWKQSDEMDEMLRQHEEKNPGHSAPLDKYARALKANKPRVDKKAKARRKMQKRSKRANRRK